MNGKSKPGQSSQPISVKFKGMNFVKQGSGDNNTRKLELKAGARPTLPSKFTVPQASGKGDNNAKPWKSSAVKPYPPVNSRQLALEVGYGNYLQCFLESALLEEMKSLERLRQVDSMAAKLAGVPALDRQMTKVFANQMAFNIYGSLSHLERIRSVFDNLVDLTGEGVLIEVRKMLSKKYDKLQLEGATINGPLFQEKELEDILDALRIPAKSNEGSEAVIGWCAEFIETVKGLTENSENANWNTALLEEATRVLLEKCSLIASDNARMCADNRNEHRDQLCQKAEEMNVLIPLHLA